MVLLSDHVRHSQDPEKLEQYFSGDADRAFEIMRGGENFVWTIGHDVFRTTDFIATWPQIMPAPATAVTKALSVLAG